MPDTIDFPDGDDWKNETDPRFPSGEWRGYWIQSGFSGWMEATLTFREGHIDGEGMDPIGPYVMKGSYDLDTGHVTIRKHYLRQHMVAYEGMSGDDAHLLGRWRICCMNGAWRLWPRGRGGKHQKVSGMADYPRLITSWEEFHDWLQEVISEEI